MLGVGGSTLLADRDRVLDGWAGHFGSVLNHPSSISEEAIAYLPQVVIKASLADSPTVEEVRRAVKSLSTGPRI